MSPLAARGALASRSIAGALALLGAAATAAADSGLPPGIYGATEAGGVYSVDPGTGATSLVLQLTGVTVYDIAFDAGGDLWVLDGPGQRLLAWDAATRSLVPRTATCASQNGLDMRDGDGMALASGGTTFYEQDPGLPSCAVQVGLGESSAGDVARSPVDGRTFVTTQGLFGGNLREIDFAAGASVGRGALGNPCGGIFPPSWQGLAFLDDGRLVGTTRTACDLLCFIDPDTAATSDCVSVGAGFAGLAVRRGSAPPCPAPLAGAAQSAELDPCTRTIQVSWEPATWAPGRTGVYNVLRHPADCSDPPEILVTGLTSLSWADTTAPEGIAVTHVVEAEDDSGCGTGPHQGGVTSRSSCTAPVLDVFDADAPPDRAGDSLRVSKGSAEEALVSWTAGGLLSDERVAVTRSDLPNATFLELPASGASPVSDADALGSTRRWHYLVVTLDPCGNRSR